MRWVVPEPLIEPEELGLTSVRCKKCGEYLQAGDRFLDINGGICEECLDLMTAEEIINLFGEEYVIAE